MPGGKCVFNEIWMRNEKYKDWLVPSSSRFKAECSLCNRSIEIANMGESALTSHLRSKKHKKFIEMKNKTVIKDFLDVTKPSVSAIQRETSDNASTVPAAAAVISKQPETLDSTVSRNEHLRAEIIWALKVLSGNYSYKSCENINLTFQLMFPDSEIARKFTCGEKKCSYLSVFGIAPYFTKLLKDKAKSENEYVLLFDESMNQCLQSKQLDCHIRIWDGDHITSRYYSSDFLGHATSDILFEKINSKCLELGSKNLVQLSMDGPNVNWKVFEMMFEHLKQEGNVNLLNVGSCGLHVMHNAFSTGCVVFSEVEKTASALYRLFKDSPARRDDYLNIDKNAKFPLKFCKSRWLENVSVLTRLLDILPTVKTFMTSVEKKDIPDPKTKSFEVIKNIVNDELFPAKCNFVIFIAKEIEPFLTLYQTDKPMIPFLAGDLHNLIKELMEKFLKDEIPTSSLKLLEIKVEDLKMHKDASQVNIGFASKRIVRDLIKEKKISAKQQIEFYINCKEFLMKMTRKLLDKCPLKYSLVRNMSCLDPRTFVENRKKSNMTKMSNILMLLADCGRIKETDCDTALKQYNNFLETFYTMDNKNQYRSCCGNVFNPLADDASRFFYDFLAKDLSYCNLWNVVKTLLLLSHGQASVERGFSINKNLIIENLSEESLIAKRIIADYIISVGGIENVLITKELLVSCAGARQKYLTYLDDQKRNKIKPVASEKRKKILGDIDELKKKKKLLENDIVELEKSSVKFANKAEDTGKLTLVAKSNALRRSALEKKQILNNVDDELNSACLNLKNS